MSNPPSSRLTPIPPPSTTIIPPIPPRPLNLSPSRYDLFVFGDSFSDIGKFYQATNKTIPLSPPYDSGRFSDGPVAVEWLALQLGFNITPNTNFAIGGAQTGTTNLNSSASLGQLGGLLSQVNSFSSQAAQLGADTGDLYVIWAGADEFLSLPNLNPDTVNAAIASAVANITTAVSTLAQSGAKNIVVAQTPNLGRVPQSLAAGQLESLTNLSRAFNSSLNDRLTALEPTLPGANILLTDLFTPLENAAQNPTASGFSNVTTGYLASVANPVPLNPFINQSGFFFWDQIHPTSNGHLLFRDALARSIISGITQNVRREGTPLDNTVTGFSGNDRVLGLAGNDFLYGYAGKDTLEGGEGNDILEGDAGNDILIGGKNNDSLRGGRGNDRLIGVDPKGRRPGQGESDELFGDTGRDLFVLGDRRGAFYVGRSSRGNGSRDYGIIRDFQKGDRIQLAGSLNDYVIEQRGGLPSIFLKTSGDLDLIGTVAGTSNVSLVTQAIVTV